MQQKNVFLSFKVVSYGVLAVMASAICYGLAIAILYWDGISV